MYEEIIAEKAIKYFSYDAKFQQDEEGDWNYEACEPYVASEGDFSEIIEPISAKLVGIDHADIDAVIDEALTHYDPLS